MARVPFSFNDLSRECEIQTGFHHLDGNTFGLRIIVPEGLYGEYPFNASAYGFLQQLRQEIFEAGTIELPGLPVNPTNHRLAIRSPKEHAYSANPFLTDYCQSPHQDTPPYPTAFWLGEHRQYFSTWLLSEVAVARWLEFTRNNPGLSIDDAHRLLVPESLAKVTGLLVNQSPGLILIDNSHHHSLYHARTCNFAAVERDTAFDSDTPLYAFNEVGLLNYIDTIDSRRGSGDRDAVDQDEMKKYMSQENPSALA